MMSRYRLALLKKGLTRKRIVESDRMLFNPKPSLLQFSVQSACFLMILRGFQPTLGGTLNTSCDSLFGRRFRGLIVHSHVPEPYFLLPSRPYLVTCFEGFYVDQVQLLRSWSLIWSRIAVD